MEACANMRLPAAAAAAAPPKLVRLWQPMQSWLVVLPWWLPMVTVLKDVPYHFVPLGLWQLVHLGVPTAALPVPVDGRNVVVCGMVVVLPKDVNTVSEWQPLQSQLPPVPFAIGTCTGESVAGLPPVPPPVVVARLVTPYHFMPAVWQLAQLLVILVCTIAVPGPKLVNTRWQTLQSSLVGSGMCPPETPTAGEVMICLGWNAVWPEVYVPNVPPPPDVAGVNTGPA